MTRLITVAAFLAIMAPIAAQAAPSAAHAKLVAAMDRAYNLSFPVSQPNQVATAQPVRSTPMPTLNRTITPSHARTATSVPTSHKG